MSPDDIAQRVAAFDEFSEQVASRMPGESEKTVDQARNAGDKDEELDAEQPSSRQWEFDAVVEMQATQDLSLNRLKVRGGVSE